MPPWTRHPRSRLGRWPSVGSIFLMPTAKNPTYPFAGRPVYRQSHVKVRTPDTCGILPAAGNSNPWLEHRVQFAFELHHVSHDNWCDKKQKLPPTDSSISFNNSGVWHYLLRRQSSYRPWKHNAIPHKPGLRRSPAARSWVCDGRQSIQIPKGSHSKARWRFGRRRPFLAVSR